MKPTLGEDVTSILAITAGAVVSAGLTVALLAREPAAPASGRMEVRRPDVQITYLHRPVLKMGPNRGLIPAGYRAVSVPVDDITALAGWVRRGSRVDVMVTLDDVRVGGEPVTRLVLRNVEVLGNETMSRKQSGQAIAVVTMLVTPPDAEKLALAETSGRLHFALRSEIGREQSQEPSRAEPRPRGR